METYFRSSASFQKFPLNDSLIENNIIDYIRRSGLTVFRHSKQTINIYDKKRIKIIVANLKDNRPLFAVKYPIDSFPSNMFILNKDYYILPKSIKDIDEYLSTRHYCRYRYKSEYRPPTSTDASMILYEYSHIPYNIHLIKYKDNFTIVLEYNYNICSIEDSFIDIAILTTVDRTTIMSNYIENIDFNIKSGEKIIVDIDKYINNLYDNTIYSDIQLYPTFSLSNINFKTSDLSSSEIEWRDKISMLGNNLKKV